MMLELERLVAVLALELARVRIDVVTDHVTLQSMQRVELFVALIAR